MIVNLSRHSNKNQIEHQLNIPTYSDTYRHQGRDPSVLQQTIQDFESQSINWIQAYNNKEDINKTRQGMVFCNPTLPKS